MEIVRLFYDYARFVYKYTMYLQFFLINFWSILRYVPLFLLFPPSFSSLVSHLFRGPNEAVARFISSTKSQVYINIARKLDNLTGGKQARKTWSLCSTQRGTSYTIDLPVGLVSNHTRGSKSGKSDVDSRSVEQVGPLAPVNRLSSKIDAKNL